MRFLLLFLLPCLSFASPLLDPSSTYTVKKELKGAGVAPKAIENAYSETNIDFQSFDLNDTSGKPLLSSKTEQLVKMKTLPKDPKDTQAIKDGLDHRVEITFEKLLTVSSVKVAGLPKPFETRSDLGAFLMNKPIVVKGDGKTGKRVEGLEAIRAKMGEVRDPIAQQTLSGLLKEEILLKTGTAGAQDASCLGSLGGKNPGAKWTFFREEQGARLDYECEFEGWAEVKGKKVAVIKVQSKKARQQRTQPNGVPGMTETESSGTVYFEPENQESMMKMETTILAEPLESEIKSLEAKGKQVPRNRTRMWHTSRLYPLL